MKELTSSDRLRDKCTAVALGIFDGVHRGHRAVIGKAVDNAMQNGCLPAVCTFRTATVDTKGSEYRPIYSDEAKCVLLEKAGVDYVYMPDFGTVKNLSPEDFVCHILRDIMNAQEIICGKDFRFGKNASCNTDGLRSICDIHGMRLTVVDDVTESGIRICSADIRKYISGGEIGKANVLLGHDYTVTGEVIHGNHFGRQMNFPTANQLMSTASVMPAFGVYASYSELDGKVYRGITNIGVKPTVESKGIPLAETHFPDFSGDLYGKTISVHLVEFVRSERRFASADELNKQIDSDVKKVMSSALKI